MMDIVDRCRAAGRDERLSTGALYLEAVIEIERLRAELVAMKFAFDTAKKGQPDPDAAVKDECERLRAERDALKADAERYLWLRDAEWRQETHRDVWDCIMGGDSHLDEAIDAAMKEGKAMTQVSNKELLDSLNFIRTHLYAAQAQFVPGHDVIISRHVYDAYKRAQELYKEVELNGISGGDYRK